MLWRTSRQNLASVSLRRNPPTVPTQRKSAPATTTGTVTQVAVATAAAPMGRAAVLQSSSGTTRNKLTPIAATHRRFCVTTACARCLQTKNRYLFDIINIAIPVLSQRPLSHDKSTLCDRTKLGSQQSIWPPSAFWPPKCFSAITMAMAVGIRCAAEMQLTSLPGCWCPSF